MGILEDIKKKAEELASEAITGAIPKVTEIIEKHAGEVINKVFSGDKKQEDK